MRFGAQKLLYTAFIVMLLCVQPAKPSHAASLHDKIDQGNKLFQQEKFDEALRAYVDAQIEHPEDSRLKYNIASSHYKMKNYEEALKGYLDVAATAQNAALEEKALYNAGNTMYRQGKLEDAVEYYKMALALDPNDKDAQQNLEFVREEIKRRINESKKTQQEQKQDKTCPNPQQQTGQDNQTQQEQQQQNADNQTGNQGSQQQQQPAEQEKQQQAGQEQQQAGDKDQQQQEGTPQQTRQMSKEEAEQWLNSIQENRENLKEDKQQAKGKGAYRSGKDW